MGVIHGRFQVLHNDHLKYLMAGKARCRHLVVGITNPDPRLTGEEDTDPHRSIPFANPLTYFERYTMVRTALEESGLSHKDFSVVPFPINFTELYAYYVPLRATFFVTIYDDWGRKKLERFRCLGLKTEVLWERPRAQKGLSASDIRLHMVRGEDWKHLVPPSTERLMTLWRIPNRLGELYKIEHRKPADHESLAVTTNA
jgi:nicotinamide mononucleotide adenylyltransferase